MSNEELKAMGYTRKERRQILRINKKPMAAVWVANHHVIPSYRQMANEVIRSWYVQS